MRHQSWVVLACVVGLAAGLGACDSKKVFGCMPVDDPWMKPPGQRDAIFDLNVKPNVAFVVVAPEKFDRALGKLKKSHFLILKPKDMADLGVVAPADTAGLTPYLIRAISSRQASGGKYYATYLDNSVWLRYERSDHDTCAPLFHETAVVWLPKDPVGIFSTASVVQ